MGQQIQTGLTSVTGTVESEIDAKTMLKADASAAVGTTDVFTVTAGKTAYISSVALCAYDGVANQTYYAEAQDSDGNAFLKVGGVLMNGQAVASQVANAIHFPAGREPTIAATKKMQLVVSGANGVGIINVHYYEE